MAAFATLGYKPCPGDDLEVGVEKVALYVHPNGKPKHMARQLPKGRWTSKLGRDIDIEHGLEDLTGDLYGQVVQILKRPRRV